MKSNLFFLATLVILSSCDEEFSNGNGKPAYRAVMKPVYLNDVPLSESRIIKIKQNRGLENPGKIYFKGNVVYINDLGRGVHLYDNSDPRAPRQLGFIQIPGNVDIAIKGNYLYADNLEDLVTIDITNLANPVEVSRIQNTFPIRTEPPISFVRYECPDPSKGIVVNWVIASLSELSNPNCYKTN